MWYNEKVMGETGRKNSMTESMDLSAVREICSALTTSLKLEQVLNTIMEKVEGLIRPSAWLLFLVDQGSGELTAEISATALSKSLEDLKFKKGEGIAGWAVSEGKSLHLKDPYKDARFSDKVDRLAGLKSKEVLCAPII